MKRNILAALIVLALAPFASVKADNNYSLLVNTADGNTVEYAFEYLPIATFEGDVMIISDDRNASGTRYAMDNVVNMTIKSATSGVESVAEVDHIKVALANDILTVEGLEPDNNVMIYDAAGRLAASGISDIAGSASIDISGLGKGVYVVSTPKNSFKFIR